MHDWELEELQRWGQWGNWDVSSKEIDIGYRAPPLLTSLMLDISGLAPLLFISHRDTQTTTGPERRNQAWAEAMTPNNSSFSIVSRPPHSSGQPKGLQTLSLSPDEDGGYGVISTAVVPGNLLCWMQGHWLVCYGQVLVCLD